MGRGVAVGVLAGVTLAVACATSGPLPASLGPRERWDARFRTADGGLARCPDGSEGIMTRPEVDRLALTRNCYTLEAREAGVEGMLIIKCTVLSDGRIRPCQVLKPLKFLDQVMLARLESTQARPATFCGDPVSVDYVFNFSFRMPPPSQ